MKKFKNIAVVLLCGAWIFGLCAWGLISPDGEISASERRKLAQFPEMSAERLLSGKFTSDFEKYSADQFPLRDGFRGVKALSEFYIFRQLDSNGLYLRDGYISKTEHPLREEAVESAIKKFDWIYQNCLENSGDIYLSIIPDKNYFLAEGYPHLDYDRLISKVRDGMPFAEYIDIFPTLDIGDYYRTDTHWRQEKILDTAKALAKGMGAELSEEYTVKELEKPFRGVYYGQSALPFAADKLCYLDSEIFDSVSAFDFEANGNIDVYTLDKADGNDPYEIFLNGPRSLIVMENPNAETDKELIIFRDSFGSSIAPLLAEGYKKITLADIRYLPSGNLKRFVDFEGADVLFLYSTLVLNNGETLQ